MQQERFEEICAPYAELVYRHCQQMLGNPGDAEDMAQECMVRAFRSFAQFDGRAPGGWLYRIAHNLCLDFLRGNAAGRKVLQNTDDAPLERIADNLPTPEEYYLTNAQNDLLRDAMNKLSPDTRLLLDLFYGDGLSYEEIAKKEGLSLGTVKSRISRAKEQLRKKLSEENAL